MKKIDGFAFRRLGSEATVVAESIDLIDYDQIVSLNSSAAYIWESLPDADFTVATIAGMLTDRYDVSEEVAYKDAEELSQEWLEAGIISMSE